MDSYTEGQPDSRMDATSQATAPPAGNAPPVHTVRLLWCDAAGVRRVRLVPAARLDAARRGGVGLARACMFLPAWGDVPPGGPVSVAGEVALVPATVTMRPAPWHPGHAIAMADMCVPAGDAAAAPPAAGLGAGPALPPLPPAHAARLVPWECCPRAALRRALERCEAETGLTLRVGFETEFVLLDAARPRGEWVAGLPPPVDGSVYCQSSAADAAAAALDSVGAALDALGIGWEQAHPESAPGQFEVATPPAAADAAADRLLLTREAVAAAARAAGLAASFHPKLSPGAAGSGCHCHLSLWRAGAPATAEPGRAPAGLSPAGEAFAAGVLHHLPALLAFLAPSPASYRRLQPGAWAGAYCCWGVNNREAALRLCGAPAGDAGAAGAGAAGAGGGLHWEIKAMDATANPHLALAAVVVAGVRGVRKGMRLPPPAGGDPAALPEAERAAAGAARLPRSLGEALAAAEADRELMVALRAALGGDALLRAYWATKSSEARWAEGMSAEAEVAALALRY